MTAHVSEIESERNQLLAEIRDAVSAIAEALERIEDSRGPRRVEPVPVPGLAGAVAVSQVSLEKALQLVRDALDSRHESGKGIGYISERLFETEDLLSRELGNPIWEGRRE